MTNTDFVNKNKSLKIKVDELEDMLLYLFLSAPIELFAFNKSLNYFISKSYLGKRINCYMPSNYDYDEDSYNPYADSECYHVYCRMRRDKLDQFEFYKRNSSFEERIKPYAQQIASLNEANANIMKYFGILDANKEEIYARVESSLMQRIDKELAKTNIPIEIKRLENQLADISKKFFELEDYANDEESKYDILKLKIKSYFRKRNSNGK